MTHPDADSHVYVATPPTSEPVTVSEMKLHLRVDHSEEDALIATLISSARQYVEEYCQITLMTTNLQLVSDLWPTMDTGIKPDTILLPMPPLQSNVVTITYKGSDGSTNNLDDSLYDVDIYSTPGRVFPVYGEEWPDLRAEPHAVVITYVAGYSSAANVPAALKTAIKMVAADWFRNRETNIQGTIVTELPLGVQSILAPYRIYVS